MIRSLLVAALLAVPAAAAAQQRLPDNILRFCADPDNPPFTQEQGADRGAYIEIAELIAKKLEMKAQYTWWRSLYGRRAIRNTLLSDHCDAYLGLPDDRGMLGRQVTLTRPFTRVGQAVVLPKGVAFSRLDELKGKRVAVQFRSHPQLIMATLPGYTWVTFREAEEAIDALKRGEADAAFVWGPSAGAHNKAKHGGEFQVISVDGEAMQWGVVIGVRPRETALVEKLNGAIDALRPEFDRIVERYGFPLDKPVPIDVKLLTGAGPAALQVAVPGETMTDVGPGVGAIDVSIRLAQAKPVAPSAPAAGGGGFKNPYTGNAEAISAGRSEFNNHCSHCHAPNAMSPEQSRDLRRQRIRYGDKAMEVTHATITNGRPDRGMPAWKEIIGPDHILKVMAFLETVQRAP